MTKLYISLSLLLNISIAAMDTEQDGTPSKKEIEQPKTYNFVAIPAGTVLNQHTGTISQSLFSLGKDGTFYFNPTVTIDGQRSPAHSKDTNS